jgi:hypothetical protein
MKNHKFITAHFINNEKTTVLAQWAGPKDIIIETVTETEEGNLDWEEILKHVTLDKIYENTVNNNRENRLAFENTIKSIAESEGLTVQSMLQDDVFDVVINTITAEIDEESLFKFKLKLFDIPAVVESKSRKIKADIRKAKTITEAIAEYSKL